MLLRAGFYLIFLLYSAIGHSEEDRNTHKNWGQIPFWLEMRQTVQISSETKDQFVLNVKADHYIHTLNHLLNQILFQDHFFNKFQTEKLFSKYKPTKSMEKNLAINSAIAHLIRVLKGGDRQKIKHFMIQHQFTKSDQIISLSLALFNRWIGEEVFRLMEDLNLSVNDSISYKDMNSQFIQGDFKNSNETTVILSHHLAGAGDLRITQKLLEKGFDPIQKAGIGMNILHSSILLNHIRKSNNIPINPDYQKAFQTLAEEAYPLLEEKDLMGWTPSSMASQFNDLIAYNISTSLGALPEGIGHLNKEEGRTKPGEPSQGITKPLPLKGKTSPAKPKKSHQKLTYLDFEPFLKNLTQAMVFFQPEISAQHFIQNYKQLTEELSHFENIRVNILNYVLHFNNKSRESSLALNAILERDRNFFKKPTSEIKSAMGYANFLHRTNEGPSTAFVSNILLEAIRNSFLPAVQSILKLTENLKSEKIQMPTYSLDPLSLAIVTYASLDETDPLKKEAHQILRLMAQYTAEDLNQYPPFLLNFSPIDWAIIFGLLEEVQFLYEEKKHNMNTHIFFGSSSNMVELPLYTQWQGFIHLTNYLLKIRKGVLDSTIKKPKEIKNLPSPCQKIFLH